MTERERFLSYTFRGDGACLLWTGGVQSNGYGVFLVGSRRDGSRRKVLAHRYAWAMEHGPVPPGMHVLHRCDTPLCLSHLFLGSHADNMADTARKGRIPSGARHWTTGLISRFPHFTKETAE